MLTRSSPQWPKHTTTRPGRRAVLVAAFVFVLAFVFVFENTTGAASATTTTAASKRQAPLNITMAEHTLTLSLHTAPHGVVTFVLGNPSTVPHEIDIVKTLLAPNALPTKPNGQFNEHTAQARVMKEAVKVKPGTTRTFTARLAAGHYVIIDNLPGHYHDGEATDLTIT